MSEEAGCLKALQFFLNPWISDACEIRELQRGYGLVRARRDLRRQFQPVGIAEQVL